MDEHDRQQFNKLQNEIVERIRQLQLSDAELADSALAEKRIREEVLAASLATGRPLKFWVKGSSVNIVASRPEPPTEVRIEEMIVPPGETLERFLRACMPRANFDRFVAPALADIQHEYIEAMRAGRPWLARFYFIRGWLYLARPWAWASLVTKLVAWVARS